MYRNPKHFLAALCLLACVGATHAARAAEPKPAVADAVTIAKGKELAEAPRGYYGPCENCHGKGLMGDAQVPRLAGRAPADIVRQLQDFKSGARKGGGADTMQDIVGDMSADEMNAVAAYIATLGKN
jgi:cytochrome c553